MSEETISYFERMKLIKLGLLPKEAVAKAKKPLKKVSDKKKIEIAAEKKRLGGDDTDLVKWYKARMKYLTGECLRCGSGHEIKRYEQAIAVTAHILAKRESMFSSVKLHPLNWLELGATCGCHNWYDNFASWEEIALDKRIWPILLKRFIMVEPDLSAEDRTRLPEVLAQEVKPPF